MFSFFICSIVLLYSVLAVEVTTFNDGTSSFYSTTNITKYIEIPTNAVITNATLTLVGNKTGVLYSNTTNIGTYKSHNSDPLDPTYAADNDTATSTAVGSSDAVYLTYPLPSSEYVNFSFIYTRYTTRTLRIYCNTSSGYYEFINIGGSVTTSGTYNEQLPTICKQYSTLQLRLNNDASSTDYLFRYYEGYVINYSQINGSYMYPKNVTIKLFPNETTKYTNSILNTSVSNVQLDSAAIQNYATQNGTIPIKFAFDYANNGQLYVSSMSINYTAQLELNIYDEPDDFLIPGNTTAEIRGDTFGFVKNYTFNKTLLLYSLPIDTYEIRYYTTNYAIRSYYITTNTTTQNIALFDIASNISSRVTVNIMDERGNPVQNGYVKLLRSFISRGNVYQVVEVERTDNNGDATFYLELYTVPYQFIIEDSNHNVIHSSLPTKISSDNAYIRVNIYSNNFDLYSNPYGVVSSFSFNNATEDLTFTWNNPTSTSVYACVNVTSFKYGNSELVATSCSAASTGSIILDLSTILENDTSYIGIATITQNGITTPGGVSWQHRYNSSHKTFGKMGLFIGILFILTLFFLMLPNSFGSAVIYASLGVFILDLIGITAIGIATTVIFLGFGIYMSQRDKT